MALDRVTAALDALDEKTYCSGIHRTSERIAIALPDGDVGAVDDPRFVDWLVEHSEPAPFGDRGETKLDKTVRHAHRLKARGKVDVAGFEPTDILGEIEAVLSPRKHLKATLTDVIVYPKGGKFDRHKDTPRSASLIGTLVVGLPIAHTGGEFVLDDGRGEHVFDWSGKQDTTSVQWVALYSDVDHQIEPVTKGARVTLVYALHETAKPREDATWKKRSAKLRGAIAKLAGQKEWPVLIPCTRHVITDDKKPTQPNDVLRGADRELAELLVEAGYRVVVRACLTAADIRYDESDSSRFPTDFWSIKRMKTPLTKKDIAGLRSVVTFADSASGDEDYDIPASNLGPKILDGVWRDQCIVRKTAAATMIHEAEFSSSGYFGNEGGTAYIYALAALEVTKKSKPKAKSRKR